MHKIRVNRFTTGFAALMLAFASIPPAHAASTLSTAYSFTNLSDGAFPQAGLVMSAGGALYGTTSSGGLGWGSVFELVPSQSGWTEVSIYDFTGGADGGNPVGDLVIGNNGVLYGTTYSGGASGYGTVFQVTPMAGGGSWTQKVLYSFAGGSDGANPAAGVALATSGALYGTTYNGGSSGFGTVFALLPSASGWSKKLLYAFLGGTDGANPNTDLAIATSGALFGTTSQGGSVTNSGGTFSNWGTVFEMEPQTGGTWKEVILYTFSGAADGGSPESPLVLGPNSVLYGTTFWGGNNSNCQVGDYPQGCGTVYELIPPGGTRTTWTETVLITFTGKNEDGAHPYGALSRNTTSGTLFGTTYSGGANVDVCLDAYTGCGTAFYVKPPAQTGSPWTKTNIVLFPGSPGGGSPNGVIMSSSGTLYGTTAVGGNTGGYGTVFALTTH